MPRGTIGISARQRNEPDVGYLERPKGMDMQPLAHAMVLCDEVWNDRSTGKNFLLGTFSSIAAHNFPCQHPQIHVYVVISDCRGVTPIALRLLYLDPDQTSDKELLETKMEVNAPHPLATGELVFKLSNVVFPQPGEYRFQLQCEGSSLTERRLVVTQAEDQDG